MKIKHLLLATVITSTSVSAQELLINDVRTIKWNSDSSMAITMHEKSITGIDADFGIMYTYISTNGNNEQSLYFEFSQYRDGVRQTNCTYADDNGDFETWKINGQNINMYVYCKDKDEGNSLMATANSAKAKKFIIDTFKKASKDIYVSGHGFTNYPVSSTGFSKAWNSYGGDSI